MLKPGSNPFYVLLVIIGVAFCITACAYGVMTVKKLHPAEQLHDAGQARSGTSGEAFIDAVDQHGFSVMMVELGLLAITTFAAIATDEYWSRPSKGGKTPPSIGSSNKDSP